MKKNVAIALVSEFEFEPVNNEAELASLHVFNHAKVDVSKNDLKAIVRKLVQRKQAFNMILSHVQSHYGVTADRSKTQRALKESDVEKYANMRALKVLSDILKEVSVIETLQATLTASQYRKTY